MVEGKNQTAKYYIRGNYIYQSGLIYFSTTKAKYPSRDTSVWRRKRDHQSHDHGKNQRRGKTTGAGSKITAREKVSVRYTFNFDDRNLQ